MAKHEAMSRRALHEKRRIYYLIDAGGIDRIIKAGIAFMTTDFHSEKGMTEQSSGDAFANVRNEECRFSFFLRVENHTQKGHYFLRFPQFNFSYEIKKPVILCWRSIT